MRQELDSDLGIKIGLEVHCQITSLRTKLFCSCPSNYRDYEPNSVICEICMGLPGSLPRLNAKVIESALKIALALNCEIPPVTNFFRKNYFYPDTPKKFPDNPVRQSWRGADCTQWISGFLARQSEDQENPNRGRSWKA